MTGREIANAADGIWDDGEWISWEYINQQIDEQERNHRKHKDLPHVDPELIDVFERLVEVATDHKSLTGRYLQIWGELGELYAVIKWGLKRHRPMAQGSDGKIGDDFVEVKTISPEKSNSVVTVSRGGHFSKLLVIRISNKFEFEGKLIDRRALRKGAGWRAKVQWNSIPPAK